MTKANKKSAGLLLYRKIAGSGLELFLVHPGGPFFAKKDLGAWTVPKGELDDGEDPLTCAKREFTEETGFVAGGNFIELGEIQQKGGKRVVAWAIEGDCDPAGLISNTCEIDWPPRSGRKLLIPEVDRGAWFALDAARPKLIEAQHPFLDRLIAALE
jgi:predicted NUDIX family NTP pyrophosphohydrolase